MRGVEINPELVARYGKLAAGAADDLDHGAGVLRSAPLDNEAFGKLGRTVRTAEAYARAARTLQAELHRATEALTSVSEELREVAQRYRRTDEDAAVAIKRNERP